MPDQRFPNFLRGLREHLTKQPRAIYMGRVADINSRQVLTEDYARAKCAFAADYGINPKAILCRPDKQDQTLAAFDFSLPLDEPHVITAYL